MRIAKKESYEKVQRTYQDFGGDSLWDEVHNSVLNPGIENR